MKVEQIPIVLTTDRLDIYPLSLAQLINYVEYPHLVEEELKCQISQDILTENVRRAISLKTAKMKNARHDELLWITYWLSVVRADKFGAGLLGFKGPPDEYGEVEIGYGIDKHYEGLGLTYEANVALLRWAFEEPACKAVYTRKTVKNNLGSIRIQIKLGMILFEESEHDVGMKVSRAEFENLFGKGQ
ncbi:MAG: GNAT family N-acetyltransferase [Anaerolineales bacterium]